VFSMLNNIMLHTLKLTSLLVSFTHTHSKIQFQFHLPDVLRVLFSLLSNKVMTEKTRTTVEAVCSAIMTPVCNYQTDLSRALQLVSIEDISAVAHKYPDIFSRVMNVVDQVVSSHRSMTDSTLHVILPIMKVSLLAYCILFICCNIALFLNDILF
jgi:hypothetical protein